MSKVQEKVEQQEKQEVKGEGSRVKQSRKVRRNAGVSKEAESKQQKTGKTSAATAVSAAEQSTTVGYRAGTVSPGTDGTYVVEIPRDVTFTQQTTINTDYVNDFDVDLLVWNEEAQDYTSPDGTHNIDSNKTVDVKVKTANKFQLKKAGTPATTDADAGKYLYEVNKNSNWTAITAENANTAVAVGELNSTTKSIDGRVSLTKKPIGAIKGETYKDTLTYVITEGTKGS